MYPNWDAAGMHPGCRIGAWLHIGGYFEGISRGCDGRGDDVEGGSCEYVRVSVGICTWMNFEA